MTQLGSLLSEGTMTSRIVDVRFKPMFTNTFFTSWEQYWRHILLPVFFGYRVNKDLRTGQLKTKKLTDTLPSGLRYDNPAKQLTEDARTVLLELGGAGAASQVLIDGGLIDVDEEIGLPVRLRRATITSTAAAVTKSKSTQDILPPELYRPSMKTLTARDVMKLKSVYKHFRDQHDTAMAKGLVDGVRLSPFQYSCLNDMTTAFRLYKNAERRMNREA
eukprot:gene14928-31691_t